MDDHQTPGILAPPPLIVAGVLALGLVLDRTARAPKLRRVARDTVGTLAIAAGLAFGGTAIAVVKRAGSAVSPYEPTTSLVTTGPYAVSRNPIYAGMIAIYAGVALRTRSFPALALLPVALAVLERGVIDREERYLEQRFTDVYRAYYERVPRWL